MNRSPPSHRHVLPWLGDSAARASRPSFAQGPDKPMCIVARPESSLMVSDFVKDPVAVLGPTVRGAGIRL